MVQEETEQILTENLATTHISCPDCAKLITRQNFVGHCALQGCADLAPEVKLGFLLPK